MSLLRNTLYVHTKSKESRKCNPTISLKAENWKHLVDYTNDYHIDSISGTKLMSIGYCLSK